MLQFPALCSTAAIRLLKTKIKCSAVREIDYTIEEQEKGREVLLS